MIIVDVEASRGPSPATGLMTEFGAVEVKTGKSFHGVLYDATPDPSNPAVSIIAEGAVEYNRHSVMQAFSSWIKSFDARPVFVSDNPAYDFQWISFYFDSVGIQNPFGHSGRRIGDIYAGAMMGSGQGSWRNATKWKQWRITPHDHNPVNDSLGNREALLHLLELFNQEI